MKKKTFEIAKKEISEKYSYLKLLEFNGNKNLALFLDKAYGEFEGNYRSVLRGLKNHPKRSKINRIKKQKETFLKKYGVENISQSKKIREKVKQTNLEKYGVENISQSKKIREKVKQTNLEKYGVESPFQSEKIKEKRKKTWFKKYGVDNPAQNKDIYNKVKKTNLKKYGVEYPIQNKEIYSKIKQTNLEKYGVEHTLQNVNIRKQIKHTNLEKYGVEHTLQNKNIREKIKQTNLEKYGVECISKNKKIKEKIKETCLKKYGVENPTQNKEIYNKIKRTNLKKYGVEYPIQNKEIYSKIKKTNLKKGNYYNINEMSLMEYYNNSKLNKFCYSTVQQNYKKYGKAALNIEHYNKLNGKSKIADLWLESIEKELGYSLIREYYISTTRYHADGYDPKTNTIYEFNGDFWHGNLEKFAANDIHPVKDKTFKELYNNTIKKENKIKSLGYNIISIWENDFKI